jgi:hypothetical protein
MVDSVGLIGQEPTQDAGAQADRLSQRWLPFVFLLLLSAAIAPVLLVRIPAMVDYPNHLGRMYAIADLGQDPLLAKYYLVRWHLIPNLAMDLMVPPLAHYIGIFAASNAFVVLTIVLMATGPFAVQAALFGRLSLWPLLAFPFVYNGILVYGFTNFLFGVGLALWAIAAWIALREAHWAWRLASALLFALALFITHLHTLGLYGLTILCYEIWRWRSSPRPSTARLALDLAIFALPFLICLGLLTLSATGGYAAINEWSVQGKISGATYAIRAFSKPIAVMLAMTVMAILVWGLISRQLQVHPVAWYVLPASIAVFLIMPFKLFGSSFADTRLPIAILFIVVGMARWRALRPREAALFCVLVGVLAFVRFAEVDLMWRRFSGVYADFERSFKAIPPGSKILITKEDPEDRNSSTPYGRLFTHVPELAVAERSSLVSLVFTDPGKQILLTRPEVRGMVAYEGRPPRINYVVRGAIDDEAAAPPVNNVGYYLRWRDTYDYLYVLYARKGTPPPAPELSLAYQGAEFQLYRVVRAHGPAAVDDRRSAASRRHPGGR